MTNYSRNLNGLEGATHPGSGENDDDDDDDGEKEDPKVTHSYQSRKRQHY